MKTLVIDAEEAIREGLAGIFGNNGVCDTAENGQIGLDLVQKSFELNMPYALVMLDIVLPEIDGGTIIKRIRANELKYGVDTLNEARILVVSHRKDEPTILNAFRNGASGWISKPVDMEHILNKIKNLTSGHLADLGSIHHPPVLTY